MCCLSGWSAWEGMDSWAGSCKVLDDPAITSMYIQSQCGQASGTTRRPHTWAKGCGNHAALGGEASVGFLHLSLKILRLFYKNKLIVIQRGLVNFSHSNYGASER